MTSRPKRQKSYPSFVMYKEDVLAARVITPFWKKRMGPKFSFADVLRRLARAEAAHIQATGSSSIAV